MKLKIFIKLLMIGLLISGIACNVSYLDSLSDLDSISTNQALTLAEKNSYYPSHYEHSTLCPEHA